MQSLSARHRVCTCDPRFQNEEEGDAVNASRLAYIARPCLKRIENKNKLKQKTQAIIKNEISKVKEVRNLNL